MRLAVMDTTALSLCMDNKLPILVFNLQAKRSIERAISGEHIGTLINSERENDRTRLLKAEEKMKTSVDVLKRELSAVRTGAPVRRW